MIKLNKRLELVASFVSDNSNVCDVGCDHANLAIYLALTKKNLQIEASDININPLNHALKNIKKYHLEKKIELNRRDGINNLNLKTDTVIISGMGGILISNIINNKSNLKNVNTLILSPNNEFIKVRKMLKKLKYKIINEKIVIDNQKTYLVIKAIKGYQNINTFFGTLKNTDLEVIYYYTSILNKNTKILKNIPKKYFLKRIKLIIYNYKIKKFLNTVSNK